LGPGLRTSTGMGFRALPCRGQPHPPRRRARSWTQRGQDRVRRRRKARSGSPARHGRRSQDIHQPRPRHYGRLGVVRLSDGSGHSGGSSGGDRRHKGVIVLVEVAYSSVDDNPNRRPGGTGRRGVHVAANTARARSPTAAASSCASATPRAVSARFLRPMANSHDLRITHRIGATASRRNSSSGSSSTC